MCGLRVALFLWQLDGFSCRDAHAFNRNSSVQVMVMLNLGDFHLFQANFHGALSLAFPSSHDLRKPRSLAIH